MSGDLAPRPDFEAMRVPYSRESFANSGRADPLREKPAGAKRGCRKSSRDPLCVGRSEAARRSAPVDGAPQIATWLRPIVRSLFGRLFFP